MLRFLAESGLPATKKPDQLSSGNLLETSKQYPEMVDPITDRGCKYTIDTRYEAIIKKDCGF
jgi:hypothetical protein